MTATQSRYVVDLNRDPSGAELYAGADNTELCPTRTFADETIYQHGMGPTADEVTHRIVTHFLPYHQTLAQEVARVKKMHGYAIVLDGHSIRGEVPRFFAGRLPDLNLGTASGTSCVSEVEAAATNVLKDFPGFTHVVNGRFKGGWITRHYGRPYDHVHALQLEIAQRCYMDESPPYAWDPARAASLVALLRRLVAALGQWRPGVVMRIYTARYRYDAWLVADRLRQAGIRVHVFNQHASSIAGDVPVDNVVQPQVWLERESDSERAQIVLRDIESAARQGDVACAACSGASPANFDLCWNCGNGL